MSYDIYVVVFIFFKKSSAVTNRSRQMKIFGLKSLIKLRIMQQKQDLQQVQQR